MTLSEQTSKPRVSSSWSRRRFLQASMAGGVGPHAAGAGWRERDAGVRAGCARAQGIRTQRANDRGFASWVASGKFTTKSLTEKYLARIEEVDRRGAGG